MHPFTRCACLHLEAQARSDLAATSDPSGVYERPVAWAVTEADLLHSRNSRAAPGGATASRHPPIGHDQGHCPRSASPAYPRTRRLVPRIQRDQHDACLPHPGRDDSNV